MDLLFCVALLLHWLPIHPFGFPHTVIATWLAQCSADPLANPQIPLANLFPHKKTQRHHKVSGSVALPLRCCEDSKPKRVPNLQDFVTYQGRCTKKNLKK